MRRGAIVRMAAIGVVVGVIVTLVAYFIQWLPTSASEEMDRITFVYWFATVISIAIFALVVAVILYSVMTFRAQPEDDTDGPPIHGHTGLEIVWTLIPALLVIAIGVVSAVVLAKNGEAANDQIRVKVIAQQFAWKFQYLDSEDATSGELVMPVGRTVKLELEALDVIHSFWIPEMGQKQDAVPGIDTSILVTPKRTGTFPVVCTELCGLGHATMRAQARVVSQAEYDEWVEGRQEAAGGAASSSGDPSDSGDLEAASALFADSGCGGCHAFGPAGTDAQIGPSLDEVGAQGADFVRQSIVDPDADVTEGYQPGVMPSTYGDTLTDEQVDTLVGYLTEAGGGTNG